VGPFHPLEDNERNSGYFIDRGNIMEVWDECLQNILRGAQTGLGLLQGEGGEAIAAHK
jgi:hypothetical protein